MLRTSTIKKKKTGNRQNMVFIPRGKFLMGSDRFYPEEQPVREVALDLDARKVRHGVGQPGGKLLCIGGSFILSCR